MCSAVCPALTRDAEGRFYCSYAGVEVDPGVMPCLGNWQECPVYLKYAAEKEQVERVEVPEEVAKEETEGVVTEAAPMEVPRIEEVEVEAKKELSEEEQLITSLTEFEDKVVELSRVWERYREAAEQALSKWDELKGDAERVLAGLRSSVEIAKHELKELTLRYRLGLVSEDLYRELLADIESRINETEERIRLIEELINRVEKLILPHFRRVKVSEAKPDIGKLKLSLMKLEQMYREGRVSEELYNRLKSELEREIEKLEQLLS